VLSKRRAAAALYTTLSLSGRLPETDLSTFYKEGTLLAAHPPCSGKIRAIPFGTGSLGHVLGLACGLALSQRFTGKPLRVFAVLSDGDCYLSIRRPRDPDVAVFWIKLSICFHYNLHRAGLNRSIVLL
jgi:transketolase N-terminal domain/subunit